MRCSYKCLYCEGSMYHTVVEQLIFPGTSMERMALLDSYKCCECGASVLIERSNPNIQEPTNQIKEWSTEE